MTKFNNKQAWKESIVDTFIAAGINIPINIAMLYICREANLTVFTTSVILSITFTIIAILRKYIIREYFSHNS